MFHMLLQIYVRQAKDMGYDAAHLNLRLVQFEYASHRPAAAKPPPIFITAIQDNDSAVDKSAFIYSYVCTQIAYKLVL